MAIDPQISLNAKAPSLDASLAPLSSIMQLSTQAQALKKSKATYDADVSQRQAESSLANTQANVAQQVAPETIAQQQTATKSAQFDVNSKMHQVAIQGLTAIASDPRVIAGDPKGIQDALSETGQRAILAGAKPEDVAATLSPFQQLAQQNPGAVQQRALGALRQGLGLNEQVNAMQPHGIQIDNGQQSAAVNTNPLSTVPTGAVIPGTGVQMQPSPTTPIFDPAKNAHRLYGVQGQGGPQTEPAIGVPEQIAQNQSDIKSIRDAGDQVPVQRNINQAILRLSKDTNSGPGSALWQKALSTVSLGNFGDNYQELGKYLEKNAIANMAAMGGSPSNARLDAAAAANGSTSYNAGALQDVTKFNDATTTAVDKFRQGVDKAVGLRNSDPNALPEFKANWAKNLDPDVFRVENALRDGDKAELAKIKRELGPDKLKKLAEKRQALESLSATGRLP